MSSFLSKWLSPKAVFGSISLFLGFFYSTASYAVSVNAAQMLMNLASVGPSFLRLITAIAWVMGMVLVIKGVIGLKELGDQRTARMDHHHSPKGAIIKIAIGSMLLYLPSTIRVGMNTFWNEPNPYAYVKDTSDWSNLLSSAFIVIEIVGVIAVIRGLLLLANGGQGHQSNFGKAMSHIVAGILCINMYGFLQTVFNTLALSHN